MGWGKVLFGLVIMRNSKKRCKSSFFGLQDQCFNKLLEYFSI